jgi:hypothetical protein
MNKAVAEGKATVRDGCVAHILDAMHGERKGSVSATNMSTTAIADELNRWRVATPTKDARRHAQSVIRVLARLDRAAANISPSVNPIAMCYPGPAH